MSHFDQIRVMQVDLNAFILNPNPWKICWIHNVLTNRIKLDHLYIYIYIYIYTRYKLKSKKCMIQLYNLGIDYHDYCIVK